MTVHFSNPGEADPRAIITLGVNVKDTSRAIGIFGTGVKYAIAVCLREDQHFQIFAGEDVYNFAILPQTVRGKHFNFITMQKNGGPLQQLGFTTHLGMNWNLMHAYRELYSNMKDERGGFTSGHPGAGHTTIRVQGEKFEAVHKERRKFLILDDRVLLHANSSCEIYAGGSPYLFYRGIAAYTLPQHSIYTYNILEHATLTEDRSFASLWDVNYCIMKTISRCDNHSLVSDVIVAPEQRFERQLDYDYSSNRPSEVFCAAMREQMRSNPRAVAPTVQALYFKGVTGSEKVEYVDEQLSEAEEATLNEHITFCGKIGFPIARSDVRVVKTLGEGIEGMARDGKILLAHSCFTHYIVRETLLEEFVHLRHKCADYTREMQNILFSHIVRLGEQLLEEHEPSAPFNTLNIEGVPF